MSEKRRNLVIFEGISGSGKSTLEDAYRKANNYHDYTIHRFTGSKWVYGKLYNRNPDMGKLWYDEEKLANDFWVYLVVLLCDSDEARLRKFGKDDNVEYELEEANKLFEWYFEEVTRFKNKILIPTDEMSIEESLKMLLEVIPQ